MFNDEYTSIFPRPTEFSGISLFDINSTGNNEWERRGYPLLNTHYNVHYNIFPLFLQSLYVIRSKVAISKTTYQQSLNLFHFFYEGREGRVWSCNGNMQFFFYENYSRMKQRFYAAVQLAFNNLIGKRADLRKNHLENRWRLHTTFLYHDTARAHATNLLSL